MKKRSTGKTYGVIFNCSEELKNVVQGRNQEEKDSSGILPQLMHRGKTEYQKH